MRTGFALWPCAYATARNCHSQSRNISNNSPTPVDVPVRRELVDSVRGMVNAISLVADVSSEIVGHCCFRAYELRTGRQRFPGWRLARWLFYPSTIERGSGHSEYGPGSKFANRKAMSSQWYLERGART